MRIIETKVFTIDEHPNKDKCFEWIRNNWHDLNQHSVDELVESIEALSERIDGTVSWEISQVPDRGEYITFRDYDRDTLFSLNANDCPLTGTCWDCDLIEGMQNGNVEKVLKVLHSDTDYKYSDEGLYELCEMNNYEFDEDGNLVN